MDHRFHFRIFVFLILFLLGSTSSANVNLWLEEKISGRSCEDLNEQDKINIEYRLGSHHCSIEDSSNWNQSINDMVEQEFFQRLATKEFDETQCELKKIRYLGSEPKLIESQAFQIHERLPFIKEKLEASKTLLFQYRQSSEKSNFLASLCRESQKEAYIDCNKKLDSHRKVETELRKEWLQERGQLESAISTLWNGGSETFASMILKMASVKPSISLNEIAIELKSNLPKLEEEYSKNISELNAQTNKKNQKLEFSQLSTKTKANLIQKSLSSGFLREAVSRKDESSIKLQCRLEGKYTKGQEKFDFILGSSTLLLGGVAGVFAKMGLAARAGFVGGTFARTGNAPALLSALATGVDAGLLAKSIHSSCFAKEIQLSIQNSCETKMEGFQSSIVKKMNEGNCVFEASMAALPAGLLTASKTYGALRRSLLKQQKEFNAGMETGPLSTTPIVAVDPALKSNALEKVPEKTPPLNPVLAEKPPSLELVAKENISPPAKPIETGPQSNKERRNLPRAPPPKAQAKNKFAEPTGEQISLRKNGDLKVDIDVLMFDQEMAKSTGLGVDEIVALRKNFSDQIPTTGEVGVFRLGDDLVLDGGTSIVGAYDQFKKRLTTGKSLSVKDILQVRETSMELHSVNDGQDLVRRPMRFKQKFTATLDHEIPTYVQERLKHYKINFEMKDGKTFIHYPPPPGDRNKMLEGFVADLNAMIKDGHPPERISAFAIQDLLILHPFQDGNGRTARVIGQGLYHHLTGTSILFPASFKNEMRYPIDDLASSISPSLPKYPNVKGSEDLVRMAYSNWKSLPETMAPERVQSSAPRVDAPFPKEVTSFEDKKLKYTDFPETARKSDQTLFFGKPAGEDLEDAEDMIEKMFKYGRGSRDPRPHHDLRQHFESTEKEKSRPSGFFQTTEDFNTAVNFRGRTKYAVVFTIDPKNAEVLKLHKITSGPRIDYEKEVLFGPRINPDRFESAAILKNGQVIKVIRNPNYKPRK